MQATTNRPEQRAWQRVLHGTSRLFPVLGGAFGAAVGAAITIERAAELPIAAATIVALICGAALLRVATRAAALPLTYCIALLATLWLLTPSERIVFASDRESPGRSQIYAVDVGGEVDRLSATPGQDDAPSVSPDGRRIAFTRKIAGRERLVLAGRQGEQPITLPGGDWNDHHPAWSPDGNWIAFASDRGGNWDIYIVASDGSQLRGVGAAPERDDWPTWSPDGRSLAFESDRAGTTGIWIVAADGTGLRQFRADGVIRRQPAWARDGRLAFVAGVASDAVCYAADGAAPRCIANDGTYAAPAWSPSGRRLAYASREGENWAILVAPLAGGQPTNVSRHAGTNGTPAWTSNGPIAALNRWWTRVVE